MDVSN